MMHLIVILCGIFAFVCSFIITFLRFYKALKRRGEPIPVNDPMMLARLWYDFMDDEF